MQNETLSLRECERFYDLRDALAIVAHAWLNLDGELLIDPDDPDLFNEQLLGETLQEVWRTPDVIDRFVRENPAQLGTRDLATVESWKATTTLMFVVFEHAGTLLFLGEKRLFHVTGLYEPLKRIIGGQFPQVVYTTLLPFEGRIVYDGFVRPMQMQIGDGLRRIIDEDITRALKGGTHVTTAEQLVELAPAIAEERLRREADQMIEDLELDMKANQQLEGHHEGVLSGMSEAERFRATDEYIGREVLGLSPAEFANFLKDDCTKCPETRDLVTLLTAEKKAVLQRWAWTFRLRYGSNRTKAQLASDLAAALTDNPTFAAIAIDGMEPHEITAYRKLYEAGGVMRMSTADVKTLQGLPTPQTIMCYLFFDKAADQFAFVIPDQVMGVLEGADWDACEDYSRNRAQATNLVDAIAALRGIATSGEAYDEYCRCFPDAFDEDEFEDAVMRALNRGTVRFDCLSTDDELYFLQYELGNRFREDNGIEVEDFPDPFLEGELGWLENLLDVREGKLPRALDDSMRSANDVYDWKENLPATRALRDYLDSHVPDGQDDYLFADGVIEDLITFMSFGMTSAQTVRIYFEILEDHGFVPDEAHMKKLLDLLMNMANAMPTWANNGWAPNELHEAATGRKVFYNEDGSVKKVGRNEPCPCGSGKKYKRCFGR